MAEIKEGDRVRFFRSHDTQHALIGTVKSVDEETGAVQVEAEEDGGAVEVSSTFDSHVSLCTPVDEE